MKKLIVLTTIGMLATASFSNLKAEDNRTEERWGFGTGFIIGAVTGGPVGAILGAASGAVIGDKFNEAQKVEPLNQKIAENSIYIGSLKESLAEKSKVLDEAKLLLSEQQAAQIKVNRNKALLAELQVDIMFRTNSTKLEAASAEKIMPLAFMMEQFPHLQLQLTGHGDILGTRDANKQVAEERTMTVKDAFVDAGIEPHRILLINQGKTHATANIDDLDGRAMERKVRIRFIQEEDKSSFALN